MSFAPTGGVSRLERAASSSRAAPRGARSARTRRDARGCCLPPEHPVLLSRPAPLRLDRRPGPRPGADPEPRRPGATRRALHQDAVRLAAVRAVARLSRHRARVRPLRCARQRERSAARVAHLLSTSARRRLSRHGRGQGRSRPRARAPGVSTASAIRSAGASPTWSTAAARSTACWPTTACARRSTCGRVRARKGSARGPRSRTSRYLDALDPPLGEAFAADMLARVKGRKPELAYGDTRPSPLPDPHYLDNWIGRRGLEMIEAAPRDRPWFQIVNFAGPHSPTDVTRRMDALYRGPDRLSTRFAQPHAYSGSIEPTMHWRSARAMRR